jgi:uncharacterized spore protein YtfJ
MMDMAKSLLVQDLQEYTMDSAHDIISTTVEHIKDLLDSDRVVGDPVQIGDATILPLVSIGFGFGGGSGTGEKQGDNRGSGSGAGGGIKPVALVISDAGGVRVEPVSSRLSTLTSSISEIVQSVMKDRKVEKKDQTEER